LGWAWGKGWGCRVRLARCAKYLAPGASRAEVRAEVRVRVRARIRVRVSSG